MVLWPLSQVAYMCRISENVIERPREKGRQRELERERERERWSKGGKHGRRERES